MSIRSKFRNFMNKGKKAREKISYNLAERKYNKIRRRQNKPGTKAWKKRINQLADYAEKEGRTQEHARQLRRYGFKPGERPDATYYEVKKKLARGIAKKEGFSYDVLKKFPINELMDFTSKGKIRRKQRVVKEPGWKFRETKGKKRSAKIKPKTQFDREVLNLIKNKDIMGGNTKLNISGKQRDVGLRKLPGGAVEIMVNGQRGWARVKTKKNGSQFIEKMDGQGNVKEINSSFTNIVKDIAEPRASGVPEWLKKQG